MIQAQVARQLEQALFNLFVGQLADLAAHQGLDIQQLIAAGPLRQQTPCRPCEWPQQRAEFIQPGLHQGTFKCRQAGGVVARRNGIETGVLGQFIKRHLCQGGELLSAQQIGAHNRQPGA
mgnify:CR=1 FL=1